MRSGERRSGDCANFERLYRLRAALFKVGVLRSVVAAVSLDFVVPRRSMVAGSGFQQTASDCPCVHIADGRNHGSAPLLSCFKNA